MPDMRVKLLRVAAALALVAMIFPLATDLMARAPGREFPRCIQACNDIRTACNSRCAPDCDALFPNDPALANDCSQLCKSICVSESQDCKLVCQAIKNGTVQEP